MKNFLLLVLGLVLIIGSILIFLSRPVEYQDVESAVETVEIAGNIIKVDVADTQSTRIRGLSGRVSMARDEGMLFIFDRPALHSIWMKEMLFPLDIIWISEDLEVISIERDVSPDTYPEAFYPTELSLYVLELNAGAAREFGIEIGSRVHLGTEMSQDQ